MPNETIQNKQSPKGFIGYFIVIIIVIFSFILFIASIGDTMETINKDLFKGDWGLTVDSAGITCYTFSNGSTGVAVKINDSQYAITRNFPLEDEIKFLPDNYWANAPEYKGVFINNKWKVSLSDLVNYGENICK